MKSNITVFAVDIASVHSALDPQTETETTRIKLLWKDLYKISTRLYHTSYDYWFRFETNRLYHRCYQHSQSQKCPESSSGHASKVLFSERSAQFTVLLMIYKHHRSLFSKMINLLLSAPSVHWAPKLRSVSIVQDIWEINSSDVNYWIVYTGDLLIAVKKNGELVCYRY